MTHQNNKASFCLFRYTVKAIHVQQSGKSQNTGEIMTKHLYLFSIDHFHGTFGSCGNVIPLAKPTRNRA